MVWIPINPAAAAATAAAVAAAAGAAWASAAAAAAAAAEAAAKLQLPVGLADVIASVQLIDDRLFKTLRVSCLKFHHGIHGCVTCPWSCVFGGVWLQQLR
jgi:hypothetical protein